MAAKNILQHLESLGYSIKVERASDGVTITAFDARTGNRNWVTVDHGLEDVAAHELVRSMGITFDDSSM